MKGYLENLDSLSEMVDDINTTKTFIISSAFIAMFLGFIWMVIMKMCAACITWTTIILFLLTLFGLTYYSYTLGVKRQEELDDMTVSEGAKKPYNYKMWFFYLMVFICVFFVCTICCLYSRIRIAIKIMETAADFVTEVKLVVLVPLVVSALLILWIVTWVFLAAYVYA